MQYILHRKPLVFPETSAFLATFYTPNPQWGQEAIHHRSPRCEVINESGRLPSSLGLPRRDNSVGGFPPTGPSLALLSDFPSLSVRLPASPGARPMQCQRAPQARSLSLCLDMAVSSLSLSMDGVIKAGKVFYQCRSIKSRI